MCISMQQLKVPHPQKYLEFRGHEIALSFLGVKTIFLGGQTTEFHMHEYLSSFSQCPLHGIALMSVF